MALRQGLRWYAQRLRVMGPAEIAHRLGEQWTLRSMRLQSALRLSSRAKGPAVPAQSQFCRADAPRFPELPWENALSPEARADLLAGAWPALGFPWQWDAKPEVWRRAPDTDQVWPAQFFASIAHRAGNPSGDVRVAWEPARLQQLVSLALLARAEPAETRAVRLLEDELLSWVAGNPPLIGIHYLSAMECALRLIAVCHALDLVRDKLTRPEAVWTALLALVASHAGFIERRLSLHSSAGNHTIAEAAGLVYAGTLFPEFAAAGRWRATGLKLLTREAGRQIFDDGGGIEQAFWYQLFITDLCGLVLALLAHRGEPLPEALVDRVERGRRFLSALAQRPADLPPVGDRDDGYALSPALRLSFTGAELPAGLTTFPAAGYSLWRNRSAGTEILFDHGNLGMAPGYGHGHADALAVILRRQGRDLLIDPGTCTYTGLPEWRRYFRSTAAHNTVTVDGADQATQAAAFLWTQPFRCDLVRAVEEDGVCRILARHDGYSRLGGNIVHWRGLTLRSDGQIMVWDRVDGEGQHTVELTWNVGDRVSPVGTYWLLGDDVRLEISGGLSTTRLEGAIHPPAGWRSRIYGSKEPLVTLRTHWSGQLPCEFVTRISPRSAVTAHDAPGGDAARVLLDKDLEFFRQWL